jgi:hypothetical protein
MFMKYQFLKDSTLKKEMITQSKQFLNWNILGYHFDNVLNNCRYCTLTMHVKKLAHKIKELDPSDPFRVDCSAAVLEKL